MSQELKWFLIWLIVNIIKMTGIILVLPLFGFTTMQAIGIAAVIFCVT